MMGLDLMARSRSMISGMSWEARVTLKLSHEPTLEKVHRALAAGKFFDTGGGHWTAEFAAESEVSEAISNVLSLLADLAKHKDTRESLLSLLVEIIQPHHPSQLSKLREAEGGGA